MRKKILSLFLVGAIAIGTTMSGGTVSAATDTKKAELLVADANSKMQVPDTDIHLNNECSGKYVYIHGLDETISVSINDYYGINRVSLISGTDKNTVLDSYICYGSKKKVNYNFKATKEIVKDKDYILLVENEKGKIVKKKISIILKDSNIPEVVGISSVNFEIIHKSKTGVIETREDSIDLIAVDDSGISYVMVDGEKIYPDDTYPNEFDFTVNMKDKKSQLVIVKDMSGNISRVLIKNVKEE